MQSLCIKFIPELYDWNRLEPESITRRIISTPDKLLFTLLDLVTDTPLEDKIKSDYHTTYLDRITAPDL